MSYTLRERLANGGNYGGSRPASAIRYLVIHYTGNDGDTDKANAEYFVGNVVKASAHYFVDDDSVTRTVPELSVAWSVGGKKWADCDKTGGGKMHGIVTNYNSLSVELCDTLRDGGYQASEGTLENAAALCRELMERYGIPPENVCRHFDVTGKPCPAYMMEEAAWAAFKARLEDPVEKQRNVAAPYAVEAVAWARETEILRGNAAGDLKLGEAVSREELMVFLHRYHQHLRQRLNSI